MRILLVEDDLNLGRATAAGLREQFAVDWVQSAEDADDALRTVQYELIVLDVMLPGISGVEFVKLTRKAGNQVPVLMLTARDALRHRVEGLNTGADDYLVKPFELDELLARCMALVRRSKGQGTPVIQIGDISYEPSTCHVEKSGSPVILSSRERSILDCLMRSKGHIVPKERIMESIYDWSSEQVESNTIEVHISALRRKLGKELIHTIRGVGYMITA